jgi:hypothetical protein
MSRSSINNAAVLALGRLTDIPVDAVRGNMETNFFGLLNVITAFVPVLERTQGSIVNILTLLSLASMPGVAAYNVSKRQGGLSRSPSAPTLRSAGLGGRRLPRCRRHGNGALIRDPETSGHRRRARGARRDQRVSMEEEYIPDHQTSLSVEPKGQGAPHAPTQINAASAAPPD